MRLKGVCKMNPIFNMMNGNNNNIMMQAFSAMMSGQSPQQFLQGLPQLQGINLGNLKQTAEKLCNDKGINMNEKIEEIKNKMPIK